MVLPKNNGLYSMTLWYCTFCLILDKVAASTILPIVATSWSVYNFKETFCLEIALIEVSFWASFSVLLVTSRILGGFHILVARINCLPRTLDLKLDVALVAMFEFVLGPRGSFWKWISRWYHFHRGEMTFLLVCVLHIWSSSVRSCTWGLRLLFLLFRIRTKALIVWCNSFCPFDTIWEFEKIWLMEKMVLVNLS